MDQIVNHCGLYHWWMKDLPFNDWLNYQNEFLLQKPTIYSNHRRTIVQDIYASCMSCLLFRLVKKYYNLRLDHT